MPFNLVQAVSDPQARKKKNGSFDNPKNYCEWYKELNPLLTVRRCSTCEVCSLILDCIKESYGPEKISRIQVVDIYTRSDKEPPEPADPKIELEVERIRRESWYAGHSHDEMITKKGKRGPFLVDMNFEFDFSQYQKIEPLLERLKSWYKDRFPAIYLSPSMIQEVFALSVKNWDWRKPNPCISLNPKQGSGKTYAAMLAIMMNPTVNTTVIVADLSVHGHWKRHVKDYPLMVEDICTRIILIGPARLSNDMKKDECFFKQERVDLVFFDESQQLRNGSTNQKFVTQCLSYATNRAMVTGTMFQNGESDFLGAGEGLNIDVMKLINEDVAYKKQLQSEGRLRLATSRPINTRKGMEASVTHIRLYRANQFYKFDKDKMKESFESLVETFRKNVDETLKQEKKMIDELLKPEKTIIPDATNECDDEHYVYVDDYSEHGMGGRIVLNPEEKAANQEYFTPTPRFFHRLLDEFKKCHVLQFSPMNYMNERRKYNVERRTDAIRKGLPDPYKDKVVNVLKEDTFPDFHRYVVSVPMSYTQMYHYFRYSSRGITVGNVPINTGITNQRNAANKIVSCTADSQKYSVIRSSPSICGTEPLPLHIAAPKLYATAKLILMRNVYPAFVFNEYIDEGLRVMQRAVRELEPILRPGKTPLRFAEWISDLDTEQRERMQKDIIEDRVDVVWSSRSGSRGLDLPNTQQLYITTPPQNDEDKGQTENRGNRMGARHDHLHVTEILSTFTFDEPDEEDLKQLQRVIDGDLREKNAVNARDMIPNLQKYAREQQYTIDEIIDRANKQKAERLIPWNLTLEVASIGPVSEEAKELWNRFTRQPPSQRLPIHKHRATVDDPDENEVERNYIEQARHRAKQDYEEMERNRKRMQDEDEELRKRRSDNQARVRETVRRVYEDQKNKYEQETLEEEDDENDLDDDDDEEEEDYEEGEDDDIDDDDEEDESEEEDEEYNRRRNQRRRSNGLRTPRSISSFVSSRRSVPSEPRPYPVLQSPAELPMSSSEMAQKMQYLLTLDE